MKILVEVEDARAGFVLQLPEELSFVRVEPWATEDAEVMAHLERAAAELREAVAGRLEAKPAGRFLEELRAYAAQESQ